MNRELPWLCQLDCRSTWFCGQSSSELLLYLVCRSTANNDFVHVTRGGRVAGIGILHVGKWWCGWQQLFILFLVEIKLLAASSPSVSVVPAYTLPACDTNVGSSSKHFRWQPQELLYLPLETHLYPSERWGWQCWGSSTFPRTDDNIETRTTFPVQTRWPGTPT